MGWKSIRIRWSEYNKKSLEEKFNICPLGDDQIKEILSLSKYFVPKEIEDIIDEIVEIFDSEYIHKRWVCFYGVEHESRR